MDALSAALSAVRMTGAIFFDAVCTAPWGFKVPPVHQVAHLLAPGTERLVPYHLVSDGKAQARFDGLGEIPLTAGDVVIIPRGDPHVVFNGAPASFADSGATLSRQLAGESRTMQIGGGGAATRFVCGYFGCDRHADRLFLAGLPRVIKLNIRGDPAGAWIENSMLHLLAEAGSERPGRAALLSKMAEALFIETLRRYMEELPPDGTGWLAAARDPVVGRAMAELHEEPAADWSMDALAAKAGASRSVLAERFASLLGQPPMAYLARCRLQRAVRLLQTTRQSIVQTALEVGYESEAAFNRAFKREFGLPPARYRRMLVGDARGRAAPNAARQEPTPRKQSAAATPSRDRP